MWQFLDAFLIKEKKKLNYFYTLHPYSMHNTSGNFKSRNSWLDIKIFGLISKIQAIDEGNRFYC